MGRERAWGKTCMLATNGGNVSSTRGLGSTQTTSGWAILRAHKSTVRSLGFTPNGQYLVSGDDEGFCCFWSLETRRPLAIWKAHDNAMLTTEFWLHNVHLEENALIMTHGRDNKLRIWRNPLDCSLDFRTTPLKADLVESNAYPRPWLLYTQDVNALNFCAVALKPQQTIDTAETTNNNATGNTHGIVSIFAAPATVASERIDVYTLDENFQVGRIYKELDAATAIPFEQQMEEESQAQQKRGQVGAVMALRFFGNLLIAGYESGHVAAFDLSDGSITCLVQPHNSPILSLAVENNLGLILVSAANRSLNSVDLRTGECKKLFQLVHRGVASIDHCESLGLSVTAGWDGQVRLFSTENDSFEEVESFKGGRIDGVTVAKITDFEPSVSKRRLRESPQGWVAVAGKDGRIGLHAVYNK